MKKEVREGYKITELGEIPNEWEYKPLKDICYIKGRIGWQGLKKDEFIDEGPYLITGVNFDRGKIIWNECYHITEERYNQAPEIQLKNGDVLMTKDGTIGKLLYVDNLPGKASLNSHLFIMRPLNNKFISKYLYYNLQSQGFKKYIDSNKTGSTIPAITQASMEKYKLILPSTREQEKIASILSIVDKQIENIEKLIQKNQELKKGLMQQLFIKGIGHIKFKKTEIGFIPDKWQIKKLSDLADIKRGASPRPINDKKWFSNEKNIGWIRISDVTNTKKYLNATEQYLSEEGKKKSRLVKKNDLIMSICATIGKPIILNMDACIHDGFVLFDNMLNDNVDTEYLFYWLQKKEEEFKGMGQTGTQLNLNTTIVGNTIIALPSLVEQKKISKILSELDEKLEQYQNKKENLEKIKKGMMQQLLTGKIRVIN
ncbi:restriction endonuclease subunit S [Clostridium perfringens]|uniref:restriction endonuclease subunit S n=1 Tax=Clostridium perfringens TaxID=1502 RepID=UPI002973D8CE|nr:restriction endonuclease subunit S [Clostridium perfringens]